MKSLQPFGPFHCVGCDSATAFWGYMDISDNKIANKYQQSFTLLCLTIFEKLNANKTATFFFF